MQDEMEIMDRDDVNAVRYPNIKHEGESDSSERKITTVGRDITGSSVHETAYFPLNFCMRDIVIDSIARKYNAGAENYPAGNDDEEHFLIGTAACRRERFKIDCPYLKKVNLKISGAQNVDLSDAFAIYLLAELDDSNENRQKFLVMTKQELYIMNDTPIFDHYKYRDVHFTPDGINLKSFTDSVSVNLLSYRFDERFLKFAHEFMLLRFTTLADVRERHPFASLIDDKGNPDMVADMKLDVDKMDLLPVTGKRCAYLRFLVDTAAAEGHLEAQTMLRLCYMAREFKIPADSLESWLKHASRGGIREKRLQGELEQLLNFIDGQNGKYRFAFIQDLIEAGTDSEGVFHRQELLKIFKRQKFETADFVEHYLAYVSTRRKAEYELQSALQSMTKKGRNFETAIRALNYMGRMNLQIVAMGAILNEQ